MKNKALPLKEMSIAEIYNGNQATYEVPIYQRNYAWGKDEISALIQDVYDAYEAKKQTYFIGTLVSYHKGDQVYEIIDGQQRLTTIYLILRAMKVDIQNKLTYRARKKSNDTICSLPDFSVDEKDYAIINGFHYAKSAIAEIVPKDELDEFKKYFQDHVDLIHYQVPKDIDLNHYFEIMNSRGEQLEKHEIVKAKLLETLNNTDKIIFTRIWESCSDMSVYIQQKYSKAENAFRIFGGELCQFCVNSFEELRLQGKDEEKASADKITINDLLHQADATECADDEDSPDTFQPIIDFSNFLLIVLKITRIEEENFKPIEFSLDDKELLHEFINEEVRITEDFSKEYGFNLLKAKYLLDNYIVHHANEEDTIESNPWKLQCWHKPNGAKKGYPKNLCEQNDAVQRKLVQLLSMFEVSFTARQRKNYLFYCLLYLFQNDPTDLDQYCAFVSGLADKYFKDIYLDKSKLNDINTPMPGSFDEMILKQNQLDREIHNNIFDFNAIYGNGEHASKGIPLFIFNYIDYKLWEKYENELRGEKAREESDARKSFFSALGCSDFGLDIFRQFYFSRTRRSLEHYYPQANATGKNHALNQDQINCLGNYAMIGSAVNSSGSNSSPITKRIHYLDNSKIKKNQCGIDQIHDYDAKM